MLSLENFIVNLYLKILRPIIYTLNFQNDLLDIVTLTLSLFLYFFSLEVQQQNLVLQMGNTDTPY